MALTQTPEQLGSQVRQVRKSLGLTQPEVALAAGVGLRFVVDLEAGKPTLQLAKTLQVIDVLGGELHVQWAPSSAPDNHPQDSAS